MLKFLRSFALAAAMLLPFAAQAQPQSWTVADGTDVIAGVPLDFYNTDGSGNRQAQMLYPASLLSSMDGATIGNLTFYHQSTNSKTVSASTWYIRLGETTATSLSEGFSSETLTTVYSGSITFASGVLSIELTTPYTYGGGNLIVEIQTSGANGNWYGSNSQGLYGTNGIGSTYSTMSTPNHNTFLPKVVFTEAPSCFPVTGLAIDAVQTTTSSLTFTWTDANNTGASYDIYTVTATDTTFLTNVASTTYTATGLEANTSYSFAVAANCGATDGLAEKVFVSGRTACVAISSLPYTCGFEASENPSGSNVLPYCWTKYNGGVGNYPYSNSSYAKSGSYSLYYYYYYGYGSYPDSMIAVLPQIDITTLPLNTLRLRFFGRGNYSGVGGDIQVGTMSDPADPSTFTLVQTVAVSGSSYAADPFVVTGFPATTDQYIALLFVHGTSSASIYLDDITLDLLPSCFEPTGLALAGLTASSLTFSWSGSATSYTATLYDASNTVVGTSQTVTDTFCTFSGLTVGSTYTVKVVANCGSETSPEVSLAATLDYCAPDPTSVDGNGIIGVAFGGMTNTTAHPTVAPFYMNNSAMAGSVPAGTQASVDITYNAGTSPYFYDYGTIIWVDWNNNLMFDADEVVASGQSASVANAVLNLTFTVPATTPVGNYRMRIAGADGYFDDYVNSGIGTPNPCFSNSYSVAEDYTLTVTEAPSCMPVSGLAVHAATESSITLTWSDDNATATYTVLNGTEVVASNVADTFYTVSGLAANTEYTFAVVANCSATENSDTAYLTARTACGTVALPYIESFEATSATRLCWQLVSNNTANVGGTNGMGFYNMNNGNAAMRFSSYTNATDYNQYGFSPILDASSLTDADYLHVRIHYATYGRMSDQLYFGYIDGIDTVWVSGGLGTPGYGNNPAYYDYDMPLTATQVAVRYYGDYSYYGWVDSVVVTPEHYRTVTVATADATMGSVEPVGDSLVKPNTSFTVTATPEQGFLFTAWLSGTDTVSTANPFTFTVTDDTTLTAHFELGYATLTVASADATMGSVEPEGDTLVLIGSDIQLTATPAEHYHFVAWLSGTDTVSTDNPLTYTMPGDTTLTAHFAIDQHTVTLSADATMGTVEPAGDSIVDYGTEFSATATAAEGYSFVAWLAGTDTVGTDATLVFTVESDTALTAVFSLNHYTVTLATADAALGTVEPLGDTVVSHGSELVIEATAEEGAYFVAWLSGTDTVSLVNPLTLTVTGDSALTAVFALNQYTVSLASADAAMGTVEPVGDSIVDHGTQFTATATPAMGYHFAGWLAGTDTVSTDNPLVFTVVSDTALVAAFEANPAGTFTLTVTYDETMGSVEGIPAGAVDSASVVTLTAVPAEHYHFVEWSNGETTETINVTVVSDTTLTALFAIDQHTVAATVDPAESGSVEGIPTEAVDYGTTVTLTAVPAEGYHFFEWSNGVATETLDLLVESDTTVVAKFALNVYTVTTNVTPDASGSVNVSPAATVEHGTIVSLTAVPTAGYHFVSWSNGATEPTITVTVVSDTTLTATFEANAAGTYTVTVIYDATMGSVSGVPTEPVNADSVITLVATANDGYVFTGWSNGTTSDTLVLTVTDNVTVTANFELFVPATYIVSVSTRSTLMGEVTPMGIFDVLEGTEYTVTAIPNAGYQFVAWMAGDDTMSTNAVYTFTVTASIALTAVFEEIPAELFLVTGVSNDENMGFVLGSGYYEAGTEVTLSAQANEGYRFVAWLTRFGGLASVDTVSTDALYTFTVTADVTYYAVFKRAPVDIDDVEAAEVEIFAADGRIVVRGAESDIFLYDVNGRVLNHQAAAANVEFTVPATGVYLVKVGNAAAKRVAVVR